MAFPGSLSLVLKLRDVLLKSFSPASVGSWQAICTSLASLPSRVSLGVTDTDLQAIPDNDWVLSTRLANLSLAWCGMTSLPSAACRLPMLRSLSFQGSSLTRLDSGLYLTSIRDLTLECDGATTGSEVLCKAFRPRHIVMTCQRSAASQQGCFSGSHLQGLLPATCTLKVTALELAVDRA